MNPPTPLRLEQQPEDRFKCRPLTSLLAPGIRRRISNDWPGAEASTACVKFQELGELVDQYAVNRLVGQANSQLDQGFVGKRCKWLDCPSVDIPVPGENIPRF